ncbi:sugar ABC transporter permease [Mycoplasmopsis phocirhinis]|nr:sugar ABC transporter permease [Mycoplasmopsis phocirhinis]
MKTKFSVNKFSKNTWSIAKIILLISPLLILVLLFTLIPIGETFYKSLRFFPYRSNHKIVQINFKNYRNVFDDPSFKAAVQNTSAVLILGTAISIFFALVFAIIIESLIHKKAKSTVLGILYSQFFISTFAVGLAFSLFFGEKKVFFRLFNIEQYGFTSGDHKTPIWIYYVLFQVWRSLPFNLILFAAAINKANAKYFRLMKVDKIALLHKIRYVYIPELNKVMFSILFTNFIYAGLFLPDAILGANYNHDINHSHTLTSYTIKYFGGGSSPSLRYEKGYAAAFFSFIYLVSMLLLALLIQPSSLTWFKQKIIKLINKMKFKGAKNV